VSANNARRQNQRAMQKDTIDSEGDLSGGQFPRRLFDEFFQQVQEQATLLNRIRTVDLEYEQQAIPQIGVGERLMQEVNEGGSVEDDFETASTGQVDIDVKKTVIPWEITNESVEDTVGDVAEVLLEKFQQQFAADAQELGIAGHESSPGTYFSGADSFFGINDGWLAVAEGQDSSNRVDGNSSMTSYDHAAGGVNTTLFDETILSIDQKFLRDEQMQPVFLTSRKNVQRYKGFLTDKESGLGDAVLLGERDLMPFDFDIIGVHGMPDTKGLFTAPENLIWALRRDVEIDVLEHSDETLERDLFARYALRARHDYQIENLNAGVVMTNIR
jgi:hypothetical protein